MLRTAARSAFRARAAPVRGPVSRRSASTINEQAHKNPLVAGAAGGGLVLLGGYAWYHFSGTKKVVGSVTQVTNQLDSLKKSAADSVPDANQLLSLSRSAVQTAAAASGFAAAKPLIDKLFDNADEIAKTRGAEVEKAVREIYEEITKALQSGEGGVEKVMSIAMNKLRDLQSMAGGSLDSLLDSQPQLKKALDQPLQQLKQLTESKGEDAQKLYNDTVSEISSLMSKGFSKQSLSDVSNLLRDRTQQAQQLASGVASDAWEKVQANAGSVLDKFPDVGKKFTKQIDELKSKVGSDGVQVVEQAYGRMRDLASQKGLKAKDGMQQAQQVADDAIGQLKKLAQEKGQQATGGKGLQELFSGSGAEQMVNMIPGADRFPEIGAFVKVLSEKEGHAEKLLQSTVEELRELIKRKTAEAEKLGKDTAKDAKRQL